MKPPAAQTLEVHCSGARSLRAKRRPKLMHLNEQIKRARALARSSEGLISDLYLLHADQCVQKRDAIKSKSRPRISR